MKTLLSWGALIVGCLLIGVMVDPFHAHAAHAFASGFSLHDLQEHLGSGLLGIGIMGTTGKVVLRSREEFMAGYQPIYQPLHPLFLGKSQAYDQLVGKIDFKRLEVVGDVRAKHITPKDTEIAQIAAAEKSKVFKKYFLGTQFQLSSYQDQQGVSDVIAQVLDEHQKQMDDLLMLGEGTAGNNVINNGLYWSGDPNYVLESSVEIDTDADSLIDMHAKVIQTVTDAKSLSGRKMVLFYGPEVLSRLNGVYAANPVAFRQVLSGIIGPQGFDIAEIPAEVTPASANGWIVVNMDQVKLHYTTLAKLDDQGVNDEKKYAWFNFLMGSMMLDVQASGAIIRQPVTIEA